MHSVGFDGFHFNPLKVISTQFLSLTTVQTPESSDKKNDNTCDTFILNISLEMLLESNMNV